jgi:hypothetical protein
MATRTTYHTPSSKNSSRYTRPEYFCALMHKKMEERPRYVGNCSNIWLTAVLRIRIRDPVPLTPGSGIREGKSQDPDPGSRAGMNNPNHISDSLETIFLD